jgi:hypothetical protein
VKFIFLINKAPAFSAFGIVKELKGYREAPQGTMGHGEEVMEFSFSKIHQKVVEFEQVCIFISTNYLLHLVFSKTSEGKCRGLPLYDMHVGCACLFLMEIPGIPTTFRQAELLNS